MPPTYDLFLLLDPAATDERRAAIRGGVEKAINAGGELIGVHEWGQRPLAYEIDHKDEAEYHLLQFTGPPELLEELTRSLRIADGVLRHRIIRLRPGTPPPPSTPPPIPVRGEHHDDREFPRRRSAAPDEAHEDADEGGAPDDAATVGASNEDE
jgi:small subunit ribosomal protein S6